MLEADEPTGTYYAARRTFLTGSDNALRPPPEFMTRKQMRNLLRVNRGSGLENLRTLDCFKDTENALESKKEKKRKEQEGRQRSKQPTYVLQRFSSTDKQDWSEQVQAGCKMWINHNTGEVSDECPYEIENFAGSRDDLDGVATGAPVYDGSEVNEILAFLDELGGKGIGVKSKGGEEDSVKK